MWTPVQNQDSLVGMGESHVSTCTAVVRCPETCDSLYGITGPYEDSVIFMADLKINAKVI